MSDTTADNELRIAPPFPYVIWTARQCAAYLEQSYSHFMHKTRYAEGFPEPLEKIPGDPRWRALAVAEWAVGA